MVTRDIETFSAMENFGKILQSSHFYLAFLLNENHDEIEYSHSILSEFSDFF